MAREETIENLAEKLSGQDLAAVLAKGYDDNTLSVISEQDRKAVSLFTKTKLSAESVDTIVKAYSESIIDGEDLLHIMSYSTFRNGNEVDTCKFIERIKGGMSHKTAADIFVADNYEDEDYDALADKVESGAYFPTKYGTLSLSYEVAKVLFTLKVPLRASRKGHIPSGVLNVEDNIRYGDCIRGGNTKLVLTVKQYMDKPDWGEFYKYLRKQNMDNISAAGLDEYYSKFKPAQVRTKRR